MRKVANIKNEALREEQFNVLVDVLNMVKNSGDLNTFLKHFLTDTEKAFIGQRLNIMRMLAKNFNYRQIEEKLHVSPNTITNAHRCLEKGGDKLKSIVLQYKYKPKKIAPNHDDIKPLAQAHYPGAIRFKK